MVRGDPTSNIVTIVAGIDGSNPPREVLRAVQELLNTTVNQIAGFDQTRDTVTVTVHSEPSKAQKSVLGEGTGYVMNVDVDLGQLDVNQSVVNGAHNDAIEILKDNGFNLTGTATIWEGELQE